MIQRAWSTSTEYYNVETGNVLKKEDAIKNYLIIKTTKYVTHDKYRTKFHTTYYKLCKKNPQTKLFDNNR